jgi:PAS domain S-box-containing protein
MSTSLGLLEETSPPFQPDRRFSPLRISALLLVIIFLAEVVSMVIVYYVKLPNYPVETLLDGFIMVILIFPGLYYLQLKPLMEEISERTRAESELRRTEKLLGKVLELLPVGVWITDKNGKFIHGNPATQNIWGGTRFVGADGYGEYKAWWSESGIKIKPEEWAINRAIHNGETILNEEIEIESFDGVHKYILNSAVPILDEDGLIQGAIVVNQDITQRKKYEAELIHTNELLEKYFLTIDTHIAYLDTDFNFIRVNDTYASAVGYPPEYLIGKNHFDLYPHPENEAIFQQVVDTGEPYSVLEKPFELPEFPERGITYWDWSLHPVRGTKREIEGLVLSLVDVTERKLAEIQLERQNEELRALSDAERMNREFAESLAQAAITLVTSLELDQVLSAILEQIRKTIEFQGAGIILIEGEALRLASHLGFETYPEGLHSLEQITSIDEYPFLRQVCSSARPIAVSALSEQSDWTQMAGLGWINSLLAAPLMIGQDCIGMIGLTSEKNDAFAEDDSKRLQAFTAPAALAIHNAQLFKAETSAHQASETIQATVKSLTQTLDMEHVIQTLLDHIHLIIQADTAGVTLFEDEGRVATHVVRGYGAWAEQAELRSFPIDDIADSAVQRVISSRKSLLLPNLNFDRVSLGDTEGEHIHYWLVIPLMASEKMIGLVEVGSASRAPFHPDHVRWAEALVSQAGVALQNAWLFEQVRASSERLQALARKLVEVQENERNHISRELHDEAGQALSSLKLSLGRLKRDPDCPEHMRQRLSELKQLTDTVLEGLHRLAMDLRPASLDHLGLIAALRHLANQLAADQLSVRFEASGFEGGRLSPALETTLYRIVQEALTNATRYSQASDVGILLKRTAAGVSIFIEDNGIGFDPKVAQTEGHLGLVGMQERAEMVGGTLTIESAPGSGTSIILEVPDGDTHLDRG